MGSEKRIANLHLVLLLAMLSASPLVMAQKQGNKIHDFGYFRMVLPDSCKIDWVEGSSEMDRGMGYILINDDSVRFWFGNEVISSAELHIRRANEASDAFNSTSNVIKELKADRYLSLDTLNGRVTIIDNGSKTKKCRKEKCVLEISHEDLALKKKLVLGSVSNSINPITRKLLLKAVKTITF